MEKRLLIRDRTLVAFADEMLEGVPVSEVRRVSEIVPEQPVLHALFRVLRWMGDDSRLAAWTRVWRCRWRLHIFHTGETNVFEDRAAAIRYEKNVLRSSPIMQQALTWNNPNGGGRK